MEPTARKLAALLAAGMMVLGAACSGGAGDAGGGDDLSAEAPARRVAVTDQAESGAGGGLDADTEGLSAAIGEIGHVGPSVVKTADLRVEVAPDRMERALEDAIAIAAKNGGFVLSSSLYSEDAGRAAVTLRVPADRFEQTLDEIAALGDVVDQTISGRDVSQEFVDLEARLRNARAQEAVLLRLMNRSVTIADTIRVQNELQRVQLDIERLRGRIRYLEDQTALSTISIAFVESGVPAPGKPATIAKAWETGRETFMAIISGIIIGASAIVPVAIVGALTYALVAVILRRFRPRLEL